MKALTLWQPWASLVACGAKQVETRPWSTKHRGALAIHASKSGPPLRDLGPSRWQQDFIAALPDQLCVGERALPHSVVLCIVNLFTVKEITPELAADLSAQERIFGNYEPGRFAWFMTVVKRFDPPIPARGNRLLWNWEPPK